MSLPDAVPEDPGDAAHVIRLRGPWRAVAASGPPLRVKLPCGWGEAFGEDVSQVRLDRRFNRPTSLDNGARVLLRLTSDHTRVGAQLNEAPLAFDGPTADLTGLLQAGNTLTVTLLRGGPAALILEAQLEIVGG